ncbi:MAG: Nif3-like dinuclear metal center hexameric protein [Chloroflexia bacterium]|nr:Nif3-like dinuclear metal center hexameric protein [Chloroflexia bacterium]
MDERAASPCRAPGLDHASDGADGRGGSEEPVRLGDLDRWLGTFLHAERFAGRDDPHGVWHPAERPVRRVGLLLAPWPGLVGWVRAERLDALVVHRPWDLPLVALGDTGVLAYHLAFDERLTLGYNPSLAAALGMTDPEVLGRKEGRPIGMIGDVPEATLADTLATLAALFAGVEHAPRVPRGRVSRVAVVGAMTAALIHEAHDRDAGVYVTGQLRAPARDAQAETGLPVIAVGHARSERYGLRTLAVALRTAWPTIDIVPAP